MLLAQQSMLQSERDALASMTNFNNQSKAKSESTLKKLEDHLNSANKSRTNKTNAALTSRIDCLEKNSQNSSSQPSSNDPCLKFNQANEDAVTATFQQAQAKSDYESAAFLLNSKDKFNGFLQSRIDSLDRQLAVINASLKSLAEPYLGSLADSRDFRNLNSMLNSTEQNLDDEWLSFEYDSDSSHINTNQDSSSLNVAASLGVNLVKVGAQIGAQYGKTTTDLNQALNSASLKVSGQALRVFIKRPWFRPSIFEDPSLSFVSTVNLSCYFCFAMVDNNHSNTNSDFELILNLLVKTTKQQNKFHVNLYFLYNYAQAQYLLFSNGKFIEE